MDTKRREATGLKIDPTVQRLVDGYGSWVNDAPEKGMGRMTRALWPYDAMFSPIRVNHLMLKNRLVMAPMGNIDMAEETGRPDQKMIQYFIERARGGVGLITTGLVPICHGIDPSVSELGDLSYFPRIDRSRTVLSGWRDLAQGVHAYGSRIFVQLTPGLGRVGNPQCLINEMKFPVSASMNPNFYIPAIPCMRLSDRKLKRIVKNAGQAAADARAMGLDGVYLHGHEGYLLEQLANPAFNRRILGRYAEPMAFGLDLVRRMRARAGKDFPIMYRIDLSLALNETYGAEGMRVAALRKFANGRTLPETLAYMEELVKAGVDLFDVDLGCYDNWWLPHPPAGMPAGCFLDVASAARTHFVEKGIVSNAGQPVPIVAVGKLGYPDVAEQALRDGKCDMVMLGRPLLADPEWPAKAYAGNVADIRPCIGCQEGCINEFVNGGHPQCAVNPRTAFEHVYPAVPAPAEKRKRIAVVGAGPAGVVFATTAVRRGHVVDLFEKSGAVGGRLVPGSVPKIKFDIDNYRLWLEHEVNIACDNRNLRLFLGEPVDAERLKGAAYDVVVFATGTLETAPPIPGLKAARTVRATEILGDPSLLAGAKRVVVVGGGVVGCECAYWLKYEKGVDVDIVEMLPYLCNGACTANRGHLLHYLKRAGVRAFNLSTVTRVEGGRLFLTRNVSKHAPDPFNTWQPILPENIENPLAPKLGRETRDEVLDADLIVLATGGRADDALFLEAQRIHVAPEIHNIGDSFSSGKVHEATRAAYMLATTV